MFTSDLHCRLAINSIVGFDNDLNSLTLFGNWCLIMQSSASKIASFLLPSLHVYMPNMDILPILLNNNNNNNNLRSLELLIIILRQLTDSRMEVVTVSAEGTKIMFVKACRDGKIGQQPGISKLVNNSCLSTR